MTKGIAPVPGEPSERLFRGLLESAPDAMVIASSDGTILLVNVQTERLFGYTRDELLLQPVEMLIPERLQEVHSSHRAGFFAEPHARPMGVGLDLLGLRRDGTEFSVEISLSPLRTEQGILVSAAIRDISDRKLAEAAVSHLAAIVESSHDAIVGKSLDGSIVSWNPGAERLYGYTAQEMLGATTSILVPQGAQDAMPELLARVRAGERVDNYETVWMRKDGSRVEVALTVSPIRDARGNVVGASTISRDIGDLVRYREQLRFLAEHDALTGVRNRGRFERDLAEQIGRSRRYRERAAVLVIDLDRLKAINDEHGHKAGDAALRELAGVLKRRLRENDLVGRLGGDEFAVLLPYADGDQAAIVADDLRRVVGQVSVDVADGQAIRLRGSIGLAVIDEDTPNAEAVLATADEAMYRDKQQSAATGA